MPSKKILISILAVAVFAILAIFAIWMIMPEGKWICENGSWVRQGDPLEPEPTAVCGEGVAQEIAYEGNIAFLTPTMMKIETMPGREQTVSLTGGTQYFNPDGIIVTHSALMLGFRARTVVVKVGEEQTAKDVRIIREPNIIVYSPKAGGSLGLPAEISGSARVFENTFAYRIKDADGTILLERTAMASSPDTGIFGSFNISVNYPQPKGANGTVEVLEYSAKDGSETNMVIVPVNFSPVESMEVKAFFPNIKNDPGMLDCSNVYAVARRVPKTAATAMAALTELLAGPDRAEAEQGYSTSINSGVTVQSLTIQDGAAKADFSEELQLGVAGSCRVTSINSQILQTLKQFPTVRSVVISIDGKTEGILQP